MLVGLPPWRVLVVALLYVRACLGGTFFTENDVPDGVSPSCASALTADVACARAVAHLMPDEFYTKSGLDQICTTVCASSLTNWRADVISSCAGDSFIGFNREDGELGVGAIPDLIKFSYDLACLNDGSRYCNNAAAAFAAYSDPDLSELPSDLPAGGEWGNQNVTNECDACLVSILKFRAESPYYDGPRLQAESVYESKTSSCGVAGAPLTTIDSPFEPTPIDPPTPTCAGTTYTIQPGDSCISVSLSQSIGTEWLIIDNNLAAFCHDFPEDGELCIENVCDIHTVLATDTCKSLAMQYQISEAQLYAWNPSINAGCYNLADMVGTQLCISKPGPEYIEPTETDVPPITPTTAAPVPTDIADGTTEYCGRFHLAILGDYCNQLVMKYGITLDDFIFLNSAINENCTNLFAEESYCVQPVGDVNTYPGRPGHVTFSFTLTASTFEDSATDLPDVAWASPTPTVTPLPLASGTRKDCYSYIDGDDFQRNLTNMIIDSNCQLVANVWHVTLEDLEIWNPSLGNASDPACAFESGLRYCAQWHSGLRETTKLDEDDDSISDLPAREGMSENCTSIVDVDDEGPTCQDILDEWELPIEIFYEWNPSVGPDCSGMWAGYHYCVRADDWEPPSPTQTSSSTTTAPTTEPTPPGPTHEGQPEDCVQWHLVESGDTCSKVETAYSISHSQFLEWNPAVSSDCLTNFWGGYAYCVATTGSPTMTSTGGPSEPTNTGAPEPNQPGNAIPACAAYEKATQGDWCTAFADRHGIAYQDLYKWNTVLGANGENCVSLFWSGYWYCVAVGPSAAPEPSQAGNAIPACYAYEQAAQGDWCTAFADRYGIGYQNLYKWNTVLGASGENCGSMFWSGYYYCVDVAPVPAPEPNQAGNAVSSCYEYEKAAQGDWCTAFADRHGVAYSDLYVWNSILGPNGENCGSSFWSGYYYCVAAR